MSEQDKQTTLADISAIKIENPKGSGFTMEGKSNDVLMGTKLINIFIGENSAGKSRFLRKLLVDNFFDFDINSDFKEQILPIIKKLAYHPTNPNTPNLKIKNRYSEIIYKAMSHDDKDILDNATEQVINNAIEQDSLALFSSISLSDIIKKRNSGLTPSLVDKLTKISHDCNSINQFLENREYIPILRGLRPLSSENDVFKTRTEKDYFVYIERNIDIYTGYLLYNDLVHSLLGMESERENVKKFEQYLSIYFFEGKQITLIPKKDREGSINPNDVVYIKIGNEPMLPIYQLGDGIQALIILTVRPFLTTEPTMFFIEEPEQHLHAGMQRALIEALRACPQHKYFFTTQSNHFIDLSIESHDIALFSVKKTLDIDNNANSVIVNQQDRSDILKDLGVLGSSVLLANCSIWVEGITDKLYLRVYLSRFINDLKKISESETHSPEERKINRSRYHKLQSFNENLHYVFVEYQGSNITHWNFFDSDDEKSTPAKKINKDILLIADKDIDSKGTRVDTLKSALNDNFQLLDYKEIENYIPHKIIIETAKKRWNTFNGKGKCRINTAKLHKLKFNNISTGIGRTLEKAVIYSDDVKKDRKFFEDKSGTIKDKVKFCETACHLMESGETDWELTDELRTLCDTVWTFIEKHNQVR